MKRIILFIQILIVVFVFCIQSKNTKAQTFTLQHDIWWETTNQNMWGPNGSPIQLDFDYTIFHFGWDTTLTFGHIENFFGAQFGAMFQLDSYLEMGTSFGIHGFNTGSVDVTYPVSIFLTFPDAGTFNPGDFVEVNSDYQVNPGWDLSTHFPTAGVAGLYLDFGMSLDLDATICIFNCFPVSIMNFNVPYDTIPIFEINTINGTVTYPCINGFLPAICTDTILPLIISNIGGIGLDLIADLPYIETTDWLDAQTKCLHASGDDWYLTLQLDIIQFLSFMAGLIPPPTGPAIQAFLAMLSGTYNIGGGFTIDYNLLSAWLSMTNTLQQDFTFCPEIWTEFTYPLSVNYFVTDPTNSNSMIDTGYTDTIVWKVGHDLFFQYPCDGYNSMDIGIRHFMTNNFTNHTWDSIAFDFTIQAFEFTIHFPILLMNDVELPQICVPIDSASTEIIAEQNCIEDIELPAIQPLAPDFSIHIGPLVNYTVPLGYFSLTWYNNTWELAGFHDSIFPSVTLTPGPTIEVEIEGSEIICFGESTGVIIAHAINGTPPYTFYWSTGQLNTNNYPSDTIIVASGTYSVTVSDNGDCMATATITLVDNPEIFIQLTCDHVHCFGDSTGSAYAVVSGGTPGSSPDYTYLWTPGNYTTQNIHNIPSALYTFVATDSLGCQQTAMIMVEELHPKPQVQISADPTVGCQPLDVFCTELFQEPNCTYLWDFGDGTSATQMTIIHPYMMAGTFDLSLTVTNEWDCFTTQTLEQHITVHPKPVASFFATPEIVYATEDPMYTVNFTNTSQNAITYLWDFDDPASGNLNFSNLLNPTHSFTDEGVYDVTLIVNTELGCADTAVVQVIIVNDILFFPNVITPNGDGFNDYFVIDNIDTWDEHKLLIYNRWGKTVLETTSYNNNWNGDNVASGTYFYVFTYKRGSVQKEYHGSLTILRE